MDMTTYDAAELLGVTDRTVRRLIKDGKIPAALKGKTWIVTAKLSDLKMSYRKGRHRNKRKAAPNYDGLTMLGDVAAILGMDRRRVAEMLFSGELVGSKVAGKWYVDDESLNDYQVLTSPDLELQARCRALAIHDQQQLSQRWDGKPLPYTLQEHLDWWGITDPITTGDTGNTTLRLRPIDRKQIMRQAGNLWKRRRRRDCECC